MGCSRLCLAVRIYDLGGSSVARECTLGVQRPWGLGRPPEEDKWELRSQSLAEASLWEENILGQIKGRALVPCR